MADLQEFVSEITVDKKRFCAVCFRTENERKLVAPVALAEFVKVSRLDKLSKREFACIYCERQAEAALKLYHTLCYARCVNKILWSLVNKKMSPKGIAYLLPIKVKGQFSGPGSVKRNKLLSLLRRYQTFAQTDVLVVDAATPIAPEEKNSDADVSIVIEDDEEPPTVPRLVPIEKLLEKPLNKSNTGVNSIEAMSNMNPGSLVLYPVKTSNSAENQFLIIPEGANVRIDGNALSVANNGPTIPVLLPNGNIVAMPPQNSNQIVLPITDNVIQNRSIIKKDARLNQINTVEEIIMADNRKIGEKVKVVPRNVQNNATQYAVPNNNSAIQFAPTNKVLMSKNGNTVQYVPSNNVQIPKNGNTMNLANVTSPMIPIQGQKACEQIDSDQSGLICQISDLRSEAVVDGSDMCQISDLRSLQEDVVVEILPEPKAKADPNIDWEDKIPMDVISFMDANDPNAPDMIATPPAPPAPPAPSAPPAPPLAPAPPAPRKDTIPQPTAKLARALNHSLDLLKPFKRSRRTVWKRKSDEDDEDLIVIN